METLEIIKWPDMRLSLKSSVIGKIMPWHIQLADNMVHTMLLNSGIGLASPQIGELIRLLVMKTDATKIAIIAFNPSIISHSDNMVESVEGCLSFPDVTSVVQRYTWIRAVYTDQFGNLHSVRLSGLDSICFQHELDHLNGVVMTQKED